MCWCCVDKVRELSLLQNVMPYTRLLSSSLKNTEIQKEMDEYTLFLPPDPYDGEVMVVGVSGSDSEGIVALYNPFKTYRWSTICNTGWGDSDADVVCKQLGFKSGTSKSYR